LINGTEESLEILTHIWTTDFWGSCESNSVGKGYTEAIECSWAKVWILIHTSHYIKKNSKFIIDLNSKPKTIKFIEKNIEEIICDPGFDKNFLDITSKAHPYIKGINKLDFIQKEREEKPQSGRKYLQILYLIRDLNSQY
jgi:hypothetical protein